jgi:flagellar motor protein MotB
LGKDAMSQRVLDEREHRRGLVLGLTLAEVLILLLFLLLLALGAGLAKSQRVANAAQNDRDHYKSEVDKLKAEIERLSGAQTPSGKMISELAKENAELKRQLGELQSLFAAARRINPDDPPIAILLLETLANSLTPEDIKSISAMSARDGIRVTIVRRPDSGDPTPTPDWPPIITLSDAKGYFFEPGSAEPSVEFRSKISGNVVADMLGIIEKYKVDVIEVIGHTDEQPVYSKPPMPPALPKPTGDFSLGSPEPPRPKSRYPNLDETLIPFLKGHGPLENVLPFDNAGLGLARAAAIVRILRDDNRLQKYKILPLSAGQLILEGDVLSTGSKGNVKERRRIEIRMRRSDKSTR